MTSPTHSPAAATAVLFPGQGSQEAGMGRSLAEAESDAMQVWKLAEKASALPLREIYWDGDPEAMADTRNLQPAMTAVNAGLWLFAGRKLGADFVAGHSLGEFSALFAARVLSLEDTMAVTALRGRLMSEACEGSMAAILKLPLAAVEEIVAQARDAVDAELLVANYNSPTQYVISGETRAVEAAGDLAKARKGRSVPLPVSGAFHSPLMNEAAAELAGHMKRLDWRAPAIRVVLNVTGESATEAETIRRTMQEQMVSGVRWIQSMEHLWDSGVRRFVELGPKGVLTRLAGANLKDKDQDFQTVNAGDLESARQLL
jgi:[acyl-carrier-protein] S-malonyltransferase